MPASPQTPPPAPSEVPNVTECLRIAVDMLDLGILLVGGEGRIAFANRAAETLLRLSGGSRIGGPPGDHPRTITGMLDRQLRALTGRGRTSAERHCWPSISLTLGGGHSLFLISVPCSSDADGHGSHKTMDIIFVGEPSRHELQDLSPIVSHYRLTRAETRLLQALVKGETIGAYAKRTGITINTAKGYLKQLFAKTTTKRQSDLVRLILGNPILHLLSRDGASKRG